MCRGDIQRRACLWLQIRMRDCPEGEPCHLAQFQAPRPHPQCHSLCNLCARQMYCCLLLKSAERLGQPWTNRDQQTCMDSRPSADDSELAKKRLHAQRSIVGCQLPARGRRPKVTVLLSGQCSDCCTAYMEWRAGNSLSDIWST